MPFSEGRLMRRFGLSCLGYPLPFKLRSVYTSLTHHEMKVVTLLTFVLFVVTANGSRSKLLTVFNSILSFQSAA